MTVWTIAWRLFQGLLVSLELAAVVLLVGAVFGFCGGMLAVVAGRAVGAGIRTVIVLVRGVPLLVQAFAIFYLLPQMGLTFSAFTTAAIALSLFATVTITEIVRGGFASLPGGQTEAARSLGLSYRQSLLLVLLPQALRLIVPALVGQFVWLIKGTAIISLLGVSELMHEARVAIDRTLRGFEVMGIVWLYYTAVCLPLSMLGRRLELRLRIPAHSAGEPSGARKQDLRA